MTRRPLSDPEIALLRRQLAEDGIDPAPLQERLWRKGWLLPPPLYAWMRFGPDVPTAIAMSFLALILAGDFALDGLAGLITVAALWVFNSPEVLLTMTPHRRHIINGMIIAAFVGALIFIRQSHPAPALAVFLAWLKMAVFFAGAVLLSGFRIARNQRWFQLLAGIGILIGIWKRDLIAIVIASLLFADSRGERRKQPRKARQQDKAREKRRLPRWPDYVEQALVTEAF